MLLNILKIILLYSLGMIQPTPGLKIILVSATMDFTMAIGFKCLRHFS
jgi:hypothetical protein